jgi:protein-L-isoaspartate O-methyltransferase
MIVPGTEGYSEDAEWLIPRYESISFVDKYRDVLEFLPTNTSTILDIGAGTGIDSAWLAANGHDVIAVEPTAAFRKQVLSYIRPIKSNGSTTVFQNSRRLHPANPPSMLY